MPSFLADNLANYYKRIFQVNQTGNSGVDSTTRAIQTGDGVATSASISDDVFGIQPQNDDTTATHYVKNKAGSKILAVDTTNSKVLTGLGQVSSTTQYAYYGINSIATLPIIANTHYAIQFQSTAYDSAVAVAFGTGINPATSLTISTTGDDVAGKLWYLPDNITIDACHVFVAANTVTGDTLDFHLMSYDIDTGNGATGGDLTNGTVIADGANITNAGYEQIYYQSMTIQSANVDSGKVCLFFFSANSTTGNYTINTTIKYHIR